MNTEAYPSSEDTSDEEYVPSDGEKVSEEENSGDEEDFVTYASENEEKQAPGKRKQTKTKPKSRKRQGGIKLDEEKEVENGGDDYNKQLSEQVKKEEGVRTENEEKKKTDSLWADFLKDVGGPKPKSQAESGLSSLGSATKSTTVKSSSTTEISKAEPSKTIKVTKVFDFAGEAVMVTKEVKSGSKEAKEEAHSQESSNFLAKPSPGPSISGLKRPGGGLGSLLGKIGKAPKMSVLEKSKLDWDGFKAKEGIEEELQIHNRGKQGFIERHQFLQRTDLRQFEIEKSLRQKNRPL